MAAIRWRSAPVTDSASAGWALCSRSLAAHAARRRIAVRALLDLVHMSEYLRAAGHAFHRSGTTAAEERVAGHPTTIRFGQATTDKLVTWAERHLNLTTKTVARPKDTSDSSSCPTPGS